MYILKHVTRGVGRVNPISPHSFMHDTSTNGGRADDLNNNNNNKENNVDYCNNILEYRCGG